MCELTFMWNKKPTKEIYIFIIQYDGMPKITGL